MPLRYGSTSDINLIDPYLIDKIFEDPNNLLQYHTIRIMGREATQARSTIYFGDVDFAYSGQVMAKREFPPVLRDLMNKINSMFSIACNSCLINYYANGNENIGHHSDGKGYVMLSNNSVVTLSLGCSRRFELKNKATGEVSSIMLNHGDIAIMDGNFQDLYTHSIPKDKNVTGWRLSLTFRHLM